MVEHQYLFVIKIIMKCIFEMKVFVIARPLINMIDKPLVSLPCEYLLIIVQNICVAVSSYYMLYGVQV